MKKLLVYLFLIFFGISVLAANFTSFVPTDVDYVVRLANLDTISGLLEGLTDTQENTVSETGELLEMVPDLSEILVEDAELILFGNVALNPGILDFDLDLIGDEEIIALVLSQPIVIITNLVPADFIDSFLEEVLRESVAEDEIAIKTENINGREVKRYSLNILDDFPPVIANIYFYSDDEKILISSDRRLLEKTFLAEDNQNYRLEEVSTSYRSLLGEPGTPILSWYNGGLELGWLLLRGLGINYGQPVAETLTLGIDEEFNLKISLNFDLEYYSGVDLDYAISENKPVEYFKKLPTPDGVDTLFSMRGRVVNLEPVFELLEDTLGLSGFSGIGDIGEMITVPAIFGELVDYSSIWFAFDDPEDKVYMYFETGDVKTSVEIFSKLVEEEIEIQGSNYMIIDPNVYIAGPVEGNWFEISSLVPDNTELIPIKSSLSTMEEKYPEVISRIEMDFSEIRSLIFNPQLLLFYSAFDKGGDLKFKLEVPLMSLVELATQLALSDFDEYDYYEYDMELVNEMHEIVTSNDMEVLRIKVEDEFIDLDMPLDDWDNTALHLAVQYGYDEMCEYLIDNYAYLDAKNYDDETPLIIAANYNRYEILKMLVDNYAYLDEVDYYNGTAILYAAINNNEDMVNYLIDNWADPTISDVDGFTTLMAAAQNGNLELVKLFVDYGVELNKVDYYGYTALKYASENGYDDIAAFLIENGAEE